MGVCQNATVQQPSASPPKPLLSEDQFSSFIGNLNRIPNRKLQQTKMSAKAKQLRTTLQTLRKSQIIQTDPATPTNLQALKQQFSMLDLKVYGVNFNLEISKALVQQINKARTQPQFFAEQINRQLSLFQSDNKVLAYNSKRILTNQGKNLWKQTKKLLSELVPIAPLQINQKLSRCAYQHIMDLKGKPFSHIGTNNSNAHQRLKKHINFTGEIGQCLNQGQRDPKEIIIQMLLDDGLKSKNNRNIILDPKFKQVGGWEYEGNCCFLLRGPDK